MKCMAIVLAMGSFLGASASFGEPLSGAWVSDADPSLRLELTEGDKGDLRGVLSSDELSASIRGQRSATGFTGSAALGGDTLPCRARLTGGRLVLTLGAADEAESIALRRATARPAASEPNPAPKPSAQGERNVVINATKLSAADLARIERDYALRIPDARLWYDPISGAWGAQGGPTVGFLSPGLLLGGSLRSDASGGGTGVFINGREAHAWDVAALSRLLGSPILPARYFLTADGLAGFEGGPPLWNLLAIATSGGGGGGRDTTWNSRLSSGIDGGDTGAVFLPNGGIVSYGD
jgi:hypothetical protein